MNRVSGYILLRVEPSDYDKLISKLDAEIEEGRKSVELQRRHEDLERRAKVLREQIEGLQKRRTYLVQLGKQELIDQLDPVLAAQQKEFADVRAALISFGPQPAGEEALKQALGSPRGDLHTPVPVDPNARAEAMRLIDEIEAGKIMIQDWAHDERGAQVRVWALHWRTLAERIGQGIARNDPVMRKAYAVIMETRERYPGLPFIEALDPRRHGEWQREFEGAQRELPLVRERVKKMREVDEQLDRLRSISVRHHLPGDAEGVRMLREGVRALAGNAAARERLAAAMAPWRSILEDEFAHLWKNDGPKAAATAEAKPAGAVSNRELVVRVLGRMMQRKEIGAKQASFDTVYAVAEGSDLSRAREAAELLVKHGVLASKAGAKDRPVSIDPEWATAVKRFLDGHELGQAAVDKWVAG